MKKKYLLTLLLALITSLCGLGLTACGGNSSVPPIINVESVSLNYSNETIVIGDTLRVSATVSPNNATDKSVSWASSDNSVATVDDGVVTALSVGTITITATTNNNKTATCNITVVEDAFTFKESSDGYTLTGYTGYPTIVNVPSFYLGKPVVAIGGSAFFRCHSLANITIPDCVTNFGWNAFHECTSLEKVNYLGSIDDWAQIKFAVYSSNPLWYANNLYINGELVTEAKITTAKKINDWAFYYCTSLTSIEIPDIVTIIGNGAFQGCMSLTSIEIPDSVTSIGSGAFWSCTKLTSIEIPDSVTHIGSAAFSDCSSLTIYCEVESQPRDWHEFWNDSGIPVVWGYKG